MGLFTLVLQLPVMFSIGVAGVLALPVRTYAEWTVLALPQLLLAVECLYQVISPGWAKRWRPVAIAGVRRAIEHQKQRLECADEAHDGELRRARKNWFNRATGRYPGPA